MIRVADFIANFISDVLKVKDIFMVSGGGIMHLTDGLYHNEKINVICTHHEQTSSMALEAYSRVTGNLGVGFFTSGPGATNAITGLVGAWQDTVSMPFYFWPDKKKRDDL